MSGVLCSFVGGTYASGFDTSTPIGTSIEGGFYGGLINDGGTVYALIVAPKSSGESSSKQWKTSETSSSGTQSQVDGFSNTSAMDDSNHPAAQFCTGLSIGGYSDWYMPAMNELEVLYYNLKPTTNDNNTNFGANSNSVPVRDNYTTSDPSQTSVTAFRDGNSEFIPATAIWSSTEGSSSAGSWINFKFGNRLLTDSKTQSKYVRAVRRVAT